MQEHFEIRPCRRRSLLLLSAHFAFALLLIVHVEAPWTRYCASALVMLIGWREYRNAAAQEIILLHCNSRVPGIGLKQGGQSYFYYKYKVYANPWFAILRLDDKRKSRTLILNSGCFESEQNYRQLRYLLARMEWTSAD